LNAKLVKIPMKKNKKQFKWKKNSNEKKIPMETNVYKKIK
jgi:hypothetical protein